MRNPITSEIAIALSRLSVEHMAHELNLRGYSVTQAGCAPYDAVTTEGDVAMSHAEACFRRGDTAEALIWLERALPDTFAGLSTAAVPART